MAKFSSIWGDITVREDNITKVEPTEEGTTKPVKKEQEVDEDEEVNLEEKEDITPQAVITKNKKEGEEEQEEEEEEEIEVTEDDVNKAFTILQDEGVLELSDDDEFEASKSGLADAVAATVRNKLKKEIEAIPPVVQEFYNHITSGNDLSSFTPSNTAQPQWADYNIDQEANQRVALKTSLINSGLTEEEAVEELGEIEESGKLEKRASIAIKTLVASEKATVKQREAEAEAKEKKDSKAAKQEIVDLKSKIDSTDELAGFELDDKKKKDFKDYIFKVNARTGKTQMQENMASDDRRMTIAFLDFVNYTKADLEKSVASKLTKSRKKKLTRYSDKGTGNVNSSTVNTRINAKKGKIVFPSIFGNQSIEVED